MPTDKRQRKKDNAAARRQAELAAQRKTQTRRRAVTIGLIVLVFISFVGLMSRGGGSKKKDVSTATSTTAASTKAFTYGTGACPKPDGSSPRTLKFSAAPKNCLTPGKSYTAMFDTSEGTVVVALDTKRTPGTVNNFVALSRWHYYDGSRIFRTDPSIDIIQGGGPTTNSPSDPGPGYTIPDEGGKFTYSEGDLVMARSSGANSGGAQFFFVAGPKASNLDSQGTYVTFGKVTTGLDVVKKILSLHQADASNPLGGAPSRPVTVKTVTIQEK